MRRPSHIALMLMGGGIFLSGCDSQACRDARAQHRADVDAVCRQTSSSTGSHGSGGGWFGGRSGSSSGTSGASTSATSRGGFGAAGHAASGGG